MAGPVIPPHPAKFSPAILAELVHIVADFNLHRLLDPFAGVGTVHCLPADTWGVEIEPLWAAAHARTIVGDALHLPFRRGSFDAVITSPTYANRMADHHNAMEKCRPCKGTGVVPAPEQSELVVCPKCEGLGRRFYKRLTYRHQLGRELHPRNSGQLQWGEAYRKFHEAAWREAIRVLRWDGLLVINVSNHMRAGKVVDVVGFHQELAVKRGLILTDKIEVETGRMRFGANRDLRVPTESILVLRKVRTD